jgi:hypothetical protein
MRYFRLSVVHYETTIQAFEMIGFWMRGLRSSAKHPDATDWTAFCWGLTGGMDHFSFGFSGQQAPTGQVHLPGHFLIFYTALGPALIDLGQRIGEKAVR